MAQINVKQIKTNAVGDLIVGASSISGFSGSILSVGSLNQALISNGTTPVYAYINALRDSFGTAIVNAVDTPGLTSTVNITGGTGAAGPLIAPAGSATNIPLNINAKGDADIILTVGATSEVLVPVGYNATSPNALITKQYADSVATGLDVKNSVTVATSATAELTAAGMVYTPADDDGTETPVVWEGTSDPTFDGVLLTDGTRVLIKDAADPRGNGVFLYETDGATFWRFRREPDADNYPTNEVSGGLFTFVETGTAQADTGWVANQPNGIATLGTDNIFFTQFSAAGVVSITEGDGINVSQFGVQYTVTADADEVTITNQGGALVSDRKLAVRSTATAGQVLRSTGVAGDDAIWGALNLANTNAVTGTLAVTNGGTGLATIPQYSILASNTAADDLDPVTATNGAGDRVLIFDDTLDAVRWATYSTVGGFTYNTINGNSGTATAASTSDTLNVVGNIGIATTAAQGSPDSVTINLANTGFGTPATTIDNGDLLIFFDVSNSDDPQVITLSDLLSTSIIAFQTIDITGNTAGDGSIVADSATDTLTLNTTVGITLTGTAATDTIAINFSRAGMADTAVVAADTVPFFDASNANDPEYRSFANIITDLGILTSTNQNVFTTISLTGNTLADTSLVADSNTDTLTIDGGIGITITGTAASDTASLAYSRAGMADTAVVAADTIAFFDASNTNEPEYRSFADVITDLGLVTTTNTNMWYNITDGTNTAVPDANQDTLTITGTLTSGIVVTVAPVSDTVTLSLNINNLTTQNTVDPLNDTIAFYDASGTVTVKTTIDNLFTQAGVGTMAQDEAIASGGANETFTGFFTNTPLSNAHIVVFFNGLKLRSTGWTRTGLNLTLVDSTNGYSTDSGDVISSFYHY